MTDHILEVKNITYQYPSSTFYCTFDFSLNKESFVLMTGNSGSGKSTLISLLTGFMTPQAGDILLDKKPITHVSPYQRDISVLFQSHNTFNHLTIFDNVALGVSPKLKLNKEERNKVFSILEELEIEKFAEKKVQDLSGGQQQRVGLARCLVQEKSILILDEPFSALEPNLRHNLTHLVFNKAKALKKTVILVTHFPHELLDIATHVLFIDQGQVYNKFTAKDFFSSSDVKIRQYFALEKNSYIL